MRLRDAFADGKPQSGAALLARAGAIHPVEAIQNVRQMLRRDARPGILDQDADKLPFCTGRDRDAAARGRVTDGVSQQIDEESHQVARFPEDGQFAADLIGDWGAARNLRGLYGGFNDLAEQGRP